MSESVRTGVRVLHDSILRDSESRMKMVSKGRELAARLYSNHIGGLINTLHWLVFLILSPVKSSTLKDDEMFLYLILITIFQQTK